MMAMFSANIVYPYRDFSWSQLTPPSTLLILIYATPQKMNPKKESKREDIKDNKSEKNGMTSAMMKAPSQVAASIPPQDAHPTTVC